MCDVLAVYSTIVLCAKPLWHCIIEIHGQTCTGVDLAVIYIGFYKQSGVHWRLRGCLFYTMSEVSKLVQFILNLVSGTCLRFN